MLEEMKVKDLLEIIKFLKYDHTKTKNNKEYKGYKIVRTFYGGVFAGWIESRNRNEVIMRNVISIHGWDGACSLSQLALATEGTKSPESCRFSMEIDRIELLEVVEILDCTPEAEKYIKSISPWK